MSSDKEWDEGKLGQDEEYAAVAQGSKQQVDDALGMQLISIRLQKKLINNLKMIAEHHGVGYQPMIRDLLNRFVQSEAKQILNKQLRELEATEQCTKEASTTPVNEFMQKISA